MHWAPFPNLHSLIPMSQFSRKPIFELKAKDGVLGAHFAKVQESKTLFGEIAENLLANFREARSPMIEWPNDIVDMVARRRCVVFLGSGVSNNSTSGNGTRPPTWSTFLERAVEKCPSPTKHIKAYINDGDYLSACDIIKEKMGNQWNDFLRSEFVDPGFNPAPIHKHLFALDARIYITPNFDKIFDRHALEASGGTVSIKNYDEEDIANLARGTGRYIFKIHGDIDNPHKLVFTRRQYAEARANHPNAYRVLEISSYF